MCVSTSRARLGAAPVLAGLGGRQVPARARRARGAAAWPRSAAGRCRGRTSTQVVGRRVVGAVGEPAAPSAAISTACVCSEVRHLLEAHAQRPDLEHVVRGRYSAQLERASRPGRRCTQAADAQRRNAVARALGRRAARGRGGSSVPGQPPTGDRLLARRVRQRVGERDEVEEVVGVQVRDHDRVDLDVVGEARAACRTRRCRSRAATRTPAVLDQIARCTRRPASCQAGDLPSTLRSRPA